MWRLAAALAATLALGAVPAAAAPPTLLVLDFDLLDDAGTSGADDHRRIDIATRQLSGELHARGLYRVVDAAPVRALIDEQAKSTRLSACNGCEPALARAAGAERVLVGWVQKVSNLILNVNIEIRDAAGGELLVKRSVDLRGNTDESWQRAISYLAREMQEKGQAR